MELTGQKREKIGKASKSVRGEGLLPAVIFGRGLKSIPVSVSHNDFLKTFKLAGETSLVDLKIGSKIYKILINEIQYDPISDEPIHACFYLPSLTEKTEVEIPVKVYGEHENPFVKSGEAIVLVLIHEITVSALPADLPQEFRVDVSKVTEIGEGIKVSDLEYDKSKVEIVDIDPDEWVVKVDYAIQQEEEEEEVSEAEALEGIEATEEKKPEEGEEAPLEKEPEKKEK